MSKKKDVEERALGVIWKLQTDEFGFKIEKSAQATTKRGVLSMIFFIFNPFRFVGPVLLV